MTWQSGGGGAAPIPGLTSDGAGGINVQHNITAGDLFQPSFPDTFTFNGRTTIRGALANLVDVDSVLTVQQSMTGVTDDFPLNILALIKFGSMGGHASTAAVLDVSDITDNRGDLQTWGAEDVTVATINHLGGLGLFGHAAPTTARTLPQATITAITDANAKAAVQACANALADMGVLRLT